MEFNLDRSKEILRSTPATLNALLRPLSDAWTAGNEGPQSWSPYDVMGHLVHGEEENWIPRAKIILQDGEEHPFEPFNRTAMLESSERQSLGELLDRFQELREANLMELELLNLTPELLGKRGTHPAFGAVTLGQLLATWVVHDLGHIGQVVRVMAKQYSEAVGPWQAYLPVLSR
jgi:hypothetical protein